MQLKDLMRVFDADTSVNIDMLTQTTGKTLYRGSLLGYKDALKQYDEDYDKWDISSCQIIDNSLYVIIET